MRNLFTNPKRLPLIAPSILSADFARMGEECRSVLEGKDEDGRADLLHVDIMDGHFVPNLTMGPDMCSALRRAFSGVFLDVHLMVTDPWPHAQRFVDAGADHITFHVEAVPEGEISYLAQRVRELGATVGLAINPPTPVERIMPHLEHFDLILVMSVNPGFSGQAFIADVLSKTATVSEELTPNQRLEMDGGINPSSAARVLDAGCDVLVAASAVFGAKPADRPGVIKTLRTGQ